MAGRPSFVVARQPVYVPFSVNVFVPASTVREDLNYFAGVMNSKLLWAWYSHHAKCRGIGLEINGNVLARTPIRRVDFSNPAEKRKHNELVAKVERMLAAKAALAEAWISKGKNFHEQKCAALDRQIDRLVYDLYGLTEEEIALVEEATA